MSEKEAGIIVVQELYSPPRFTRDEFELHIGNGLRIRGGVSIEHLERNTDTSRVQLRASQQKSGHTLVLGELRINERFMEIYGFTRARGLSNTLEHKPLRRIPLGDTLPQSDIGRHRGILLVHYSDKFIQEYGYSYYYLLASSLPESRRVFVPKNLLSRRRYSVES